MSILDRWVTPEGERLPESNNEWQTPEWFFNSVNQEFDFQYDLACREYNKRVPRGLCYPEIDSLKTDWHKLSDGWLWLNPPYSPLKPWIIKAQDEYLKGAKIVMLIPPVFSTRYFSKVMPSEIRFIIGRIQFINPNGRPMKANSHDSALLIYGPSKMPKISYVNRDDFKTGYPSENSGK